VETRWIQGRPGFVAARLRARVPGARWDRPGAESGLVQILLDGAYHQDVILVHGEVEADCERLLGEIPAGVHTIAVRPHPAAPLRPPAEILELEAVQITPRDEPDALALREAPVIYTRAEADPWESLRTDTPLLVFQRLRDGGVEFQCMFSNEDGGTDTRGLLAQWGRTTDIEWVLHVPADPAAPATIQGRGHRTEVHSGHRALGRRTLQVVGLHGMVSSEPPWGAMRCLFVPRFRWDDRLPREACMDDAPWTYRLTALEMLREGKLHPGTDASDPTPGDLRDYAFVQLLREDRGAPRTACEVRVHTADGRVFSSTHGDARQAVARPHAFSTAVKLPRGAAVRRIEAVPLPPLPAGEVRLALHQAFRLDDDWMPLPPFARGAEVALRAGQTRAALFEEDAR
jgi:hypothetical protein